MALYNQISGYGGMQKLPSISGKYFFVAATTDGNYQALQEMWKVDPDGKQRFFNNITDALAATVAGRGDKVLLSSSYSTAPTLTELATALTNGVMIEKVGSKLGNDYVATKAATTLPATTSGTLFTATGMVRILDIIGEVTTTIQTQTCNANLIAVPTVGVTQNLCATADITALATGTALFITGTLATALQATAPGVFVAQASPVVVPAGLIKLSTSATNTGAVKWLVRYVPLTPGASLV